MKPADDKSRKHGQDSAADAARTGSDKQRQKDKADIYDPVGMAGKKAGIVEELNEENCDDQGAGATKKD